MATVNGAKLALKEAGGKVGDFTIEYVSLDDSTAQAGGWEPGQTASNARKAIGDDSTIAYIGEFNSGATAVSLPSSTRPASPRSAPATRPSASRPTTPARARRARQVLPDRQADLRPHPAQGHLPGRRARALAKEEGCESVYILNDKEVYGAGLASNVELAAKDVGLEIKGNDGVDKNAANYRALGAKIKATGAECFIYCGITANNAVQIFKDMAVALPDGALLGPEGVGETGFFDPEEGGLPADVASRVLITIPGVAPEEYPPAGREFLKAYEASTARRTPTATRSTATSR